MGVDKLRELAIVLVDRIRENASIDWNLKESVRARMKVAVKRLLRQYGYPPDMEALATELVLEQAKVITNILSTTEVIYVAASSSSTAASSDLQPNYETNCETRTDRY